MKHFSIVVAMDDQNGIGKQGRLPWHLPADLKHFKEITTKVIGTAKHNAVIMGRKTWGSLPEKFRPLPSRVNVVLTSDKNFQIPDGVLVFNSFDQALKELSHNKEVGDIFVIGGAQLYAQIIDHPQCARLYVTLVQGSFACDVFFPSIPARFKLAATGPLMSLNTPQYRFIDYAIG